MSVSYYTYIYYGYPFRSVTEKPNPLWGNYRFDPESGRRVTKTTKESIDIDALAAEVSLDIDHIENSESGMAIMGAKIKETGDFNDDCSYVLLSHIDPTIPIRVEPRIKKALQKLGVPYDPAKLGLYMCPYVSC